MYRSHTTANPPLLSRINLLEKVVNRNLGRFGLISIISFGATAVTAQLTLAQIPPNIQIPQNIEIPKIDTSTIDRHTEEAQRSEERRHQAGQQLLQGIIDEDLRRRQEARQRSQAEKLRFFSPEVFLQYFDSVPGE